MSVQKDLVEQICALPLAERLEVRAALDASVERDLTNAAAGRTTDEDWLAAKARLEAELQRGMDSGPPVMVDENYWQELRSRIERRRMTVP